MHVHMNNFHLSAIIFQIMAQRYNFSLNRQKEETSFKLFVRLTGKECPHISNRAFC